MRAPRKLLRRPEASQASQPGSSQQGLPPFDPNTASLFSSQGCREVALMKYNRSVLPRDRKKVEEPTTKSLREALVFAGRVSDQPHLFLSFTFLLKYSSNDLLFC